MLGSHILRDLLTGKRNEDAEIVGLNRQYGNQVKNERRFGSPFVF